MHERQRPAKSWFTSLEALAPHDVCSWFTVVARKSEHHCPHVLEVKQGILAIIVLNPCSKFLGFAEGIGVSGFLTVQRGKGRLSWLDVARQLQKVVVATSIFRIPWSRSIMLLQFSGLASLCNWQLNLRPQKSVSLSYPGNLQYEGP